MKTEELSLEVREEIAKLNARIAELEQSKTMTAVRDAIKSEALAENERQAAEISRLKGVIAKCQTALAQCKQWKEGVNTLTTHNHEAVQEALAVIQGIERDIN